MYSYLIGHSSAGHRQSYDNGENYNGAHARLTRAPKAVMTTQCEGKSGGASLLADSSMCLNPGNEVNIILFSLPVYVKLY